MIGLEDLTCIFLELDFIIFTLENFVHKRWLNFIVSKFQFLVYLR